MYDYKKGPKTLIISLKAIACKGCVGYNKHAEIARLVRINGIKYILIILILYQITKNQDALLKIWLEQFK